MEAHDSNIKRVGCVIIVLVFEFHLVVVEEKGFQDWKVSDEMNTSCFVEVLEEDRNGFI